MYPYNYKIEYFNLKINDYKPDFTIKHQITDTICYFIGNLKKDFFIIQNEIFLLNMLFFIIVVYSWYLKKKHYNYKKEILYISKPLLIILFLCYLLTITDVNYITNDGLFRYCYFFQFFKNRLTFLTFLYIYITSNILHYHNINRYEYYYFIMFCLIGCFCAMSSYNILVLFTSLEITNLSLYILAGFLYKNKKCLVSAIKYFFLGVISTGLFVKAIAFFHVGCDSFSYPSLTYYYKLPYASNTSIEYFTYKVFLLLGGSVLFIAFLFKLGAAPFHYILVEIYEHTSLPIVMFFSTIKKAIIYIVFTSLFYELNLCYGYWWYSFTLFYGVLSVFWGALHAFKEIDFKRFLGFSSVNHTGFLLLFLIDSSITAYGASLIYLFTYIPVMFILFSIIVHCTGVKKVVKNNTSYDKETKKIITTQVISQSYCSVKTMDDLYLLCQKNIIGKLIITLCIFSLCGIPPLPGFYGKFLLISTLVYQYNFILAFYIIFISLYSFFYYMRVIKNLWYSENFLNVNQKDVSMISIRPFDNKIFIYSILCLYVLIISPTYIYLNYGQELFYICELGAIPNSSFEGF